jgi:predicted nucleotidyltransferase
MKGHRDVELITDRLRNLKKPYIKTAILFGSRARGELTDRSDVDLLVLHEGCKVGDLVARRRLLYSLLRNVLGEGFEGLTVVDMEFRRFVKPKEITALLLNIYWDGVVVYDVTGIVQGFLVQVREKIVKNGLKRVKDGKAYYWVLPKPMEEVKIL